MKYSGRKTIPDFMKSKQGRPKIQGPVTVATVKVVVASNNTRFMVNDRAVKISSDYKVIGPRPIKKRCTN